jgi:hypothetical protein
MQFFLLMPGDSEEDTLNEANLLGESSFGTFWAGTALKTLMTVVDKDPELLQQFPNIIKESGEVGKFELDIFTIEINNLTEYQNNLIHTK